MYVITRSAKFVQNLEMTGTSEMAGTRKRACLLRFALCECDTPWLFYDRTKRRSIDCRHCEQSGEPSPIHVFVTYLESSGNARSIGNTSFLSAFCEGFSESVLNSEDVTMTMMVETGIVSNSMGGIWRAF